MKTFIYFAVSLFCLQSLFAQVENEYGRKPSGNFNPKYYQDFLNFSSDKGDNTRVDVYIQVPYTTIQFVKVPAGFEGAYSVTVSVFDEDKEKLLVEKTWREKINSKDFEQTISKSIYKNIG